MAHRFSWELHNEDAIPIGLFVLHKCDHPPCVNPSHLFIGTKRDNIEDAISKGRWSGPQKGVEHPQARLTEQQVFAIRACLKIGERGSDIAVRFGVSPMTISDIKRGRSWAHLH
jgi:hypothetical protein